MKFKNRLIRKAAPVVIGAAFFLISNSSLAQFPGTRIVTERQYPNCIELSNGEIRVVLEPNMGGRVICYEHKGKNVLYVDSSQDGLVWEKGKSIHPSAGRCDFGPEKIVLPHPEIYLGRWSAQITGEREAVMTSQEHPTTGVQLIRKFKLDKTGSKLEFTQTIRNISQTLKNYCHWSRTFVKGGGIALAPLNPESRYPKKFIRYGPGNIMNFMPDDESSVAIRDGILEISSPPAQPKFITDSYDGWLAYITTDNQLFIKKYPVFPLRVYGEMAACTTCVYYKELYCEIEPIGPMEAIPAGKEISYTELWYLFDYTYPTNKQADLPGIVRKIRDL
jgi:hypothetical protein